MANTSAFLDDIETFLTETGMGPSYFGKVAAGNSELVPRLRGEKPGRGRVWPETEAAVREFMARHRAERHAHAPESPQESSAPACPKEQAASPEMVNAAQRGAA